VVQTAHRTALSDLNNFILLMKV